MGCLSCYKNLSEEVVDALLEKEIKMSEIAKCVGKLKNSKTGSSDGKVAKLFKYSGLGMVDLLEKSVSFLLQDEIVSR